MSEERAYYRPVRIAGLLLVAQSAGLCGLIVYQAATYREAGTRSEALPGVSGLFDALSRALEGLGAGVPASVLLAPVVLTSLVSGTWFLLRRQGWVLASVGQGLCLAACFLLYSEGVTGYVYPVMAYCVLTIMYLNSRDVRTIMHAPRRSWVERAGGPP